MKNLKLFLRIRHGLKEMLSVKTSESHAVIASGIVTALCTFVPAACAVIDPLINKAFNMDTHTFVGVLLSYAVLRFGKKVASAPDAN